MYANLSKQNSMLFQSQPALDPIKFCYKIISKFWTGSSSGSWYHECFLAQVTSGSRYFVFVHFIMTRAKTFFCSLSVSRRMPASEAKYKFKVQGWSLKRPQPFQLKCLQNYLASTHPGIKRDRYTLHM